MKKLKLNVEELSVVSFPTQPAQEARGTVDGHVITPKCVVTSGVDSCWCTERTCPGPAHRPENAGPAPLIQGRGPGGFSTAANVDRFNPPACMR